MLGLFALTASAQAWEAAGRARSWAKQDKDESFTFYDPADRMLRTWSRDGGVLSSLPLGRLDGLPERWALDPRNMAWIAHGTTLSQVDQSGKVLETTRLPAEVGDVCWDTKGLVLSYRASEPYLEKRDFKGNLVWSSGTRPSRADGSGRLHRRPIVIEDSGNGLMADGRALNLTILDGSTGQVLSQAAFYLPQGQPAPALEGDTLDRDPLVLWPGRDVVFAAVKAAQVPAAQRGSLRGMALARLDLAQSRLEFLRTGLDETHILVGVLDSDAVFVNPAGGLALVKVR
jgi:hypothetical protein